MSAQDNAALARKPYDLWNARDFDGAAALFAPEADWLNVAMGVTVRGPEGYKQFAQGWANAFPDGQVEVTNIVASEDGAAVEFIGRGTHTGPLVGPQGTIAATGREAEFRLCDVYQIQNGKFVGGRSYFDSATMMRQLGLMP
jgi:steroid delta-isomerase-like uncharacterized protein